MREAPTAIVIARGAGVGAEASSLVIEDDAAARRVAPTTRANVTLGAASRFVFFRPEGDFAIFPARPSRLDHVSSVVAPNA